MMKITTFYKKSLAAYNKHMTWHVEATFPPKQDSRTRLFGNLLAAVMLVLALSQLIGFEKMKDVLMTYWPASMAQMALPLAALLVVLEVFAIPYLLAMRLSPLMRIVSAKCGLLVSLYVIAVGVYGATAAPVGVNAGILGGYVSLAGDWWTILLGLIMLALLITYTIRSRRHS